MMPQLAPAEPAPVLKAIDAPEVKAKLAEWDAKIAAWDPQKDLADRVQRHQQQLDRLKKEGKPAPPDAKAPTDLRPGPAADQNRPGNCYASMIAPLEGFAVKGALFHQGYNNALGGGSAGAAMYYQIFGKMIAAWRAAFGDPEMPFGIISLCTAGEPQTLDNYVEHMFNDGIYIREAQYKTFLDLYTAGDKTIGFASSYDKRKSWYHPQIKIPVGERIARWALATQYGLEKEIKWKPPMLKEMKVENGKIVLKMDTAVCAVDDGPIFGFAIAGQDRRFRPARAEFLVKGLDDRKQPQYDRTALVLSSPHVPEPVHFRFAWGRNPLANLQSADHNDLPFATQRSDDWKMEDVPLGVLGGEPLVEGTLSRVQRGKIQQALRLEDIGRRLKEARAFIDEHQEQYEKERSRGQ